MNTPQLNGYSIRKFNNGKVARTYFEIVYKDTCKRASTKLFKTRHDAMMYIRDVAMKRGAA
jgi:hypothetical protein